MPRDEMCDSISEPLQDRYLTADKRGYIKRDLMSRDDWATNVNRLRRKGSKRLDHAKQLEEWGRQRGWKLDREG